MAVLAQSQYTELLDNLSDKSLPLINITVDIEKVTKPEYTPATIEIADPLMRTDGENVVTKFNAKVKYRGNSSLRYDKKSFNVKLINEKGKSFDVNILGLRLTDAWILDAYVCVTASTSIHGMQCRVRPTRQNMNSATVR